MGRRGRIGQFSMKHAQKCPNRKEIGNNRRQYQFPWIRFRIACHGFREKSENRARRFPFWCLGFPGRRFACPGLSYFAPSEQIQGTELRKIGIRRHKPMRRAPKREQVTKEQPKNGRGKFSINAGTSPRNAEEWLAFGWAAAWRTRKEKASAKAPGFRWARAWLARRRWAWSPQVLPPLDR